MNRIYDDWSEYEMQIQLEFYEALLEAAIGPQWDKATVEDLLRSRIARDGEQVAAISDLAKMCAESFEGRCMAHVSIYGDGTCEAYLEHVESVSDDGYDHQKTKIKVALGGSTYPISPTGVRQMVEDLDATPWMSGSGQTPQGARAEIEDLKQRVTPPTEEVKP